MRDANFALLALTTVAATITGTGLDIPGGTPYIGVPIALLVPFSNVTSLTGTVIAKIQGRGGVGGTTWSDIITFDTITNTTSAVATGGFEQTKRVPAHDSNQLRVVVTITGAVPSVAVQVHAVSGDVT
jgi:hypothetical protein